jgi:hypothetical protein
VTSRNPGPLLIFLLAAVSCATTAQKPDVIPFPRIAAGASAPVATITTYSDALATVLWVMESELGFPPLSGTLRLYNDRSSLEAGLIGEGYEPSYAREIASTLDGVSRPGVILANESVLQWQHWAQRIVFLAHEATHVEEYALANGRRGSSEQWLREGVADWVAWRVADSLKLGSFAARRNTAVANLRQARARHELLTFSALAAQHSWVRAGNRKITSTMYLQAFLAADLLIETQGFPAVLDYFRLFAYSDDAAANFTTAFHEDRASFEAAYEKNLSHLLD